MSNGRYDREHRYNNVTFYLSNYMPDSEECRYLMLKVLEQAVRDYVSLANAKTQSERDLWEEARAFIYEDDYEFQWGSYSFNTEGFLDILDLDIGWVREQATRKFKDRNG